MTRLSQQEFDKLREEHGVSAGKIAFVINQLRRMTDDERMAIMGAFCQYCGSDNPHCQCWNDK